MMTREQFEELLSAALDEPHRRDLHEQIAAACDRRRDLAELRDAWFRLDARLRAGGLPVERVDWPRLAARIQAAVRATSIAAPADTDAALDELLARQSPLPEIDWQRFGDRVSVRARAARHTPTAASRWLRWAPLGGLAAAAAIALVIFVSRPNPPGGAPPTAAAPLGVARVLVARPLALPADLAEAGVAAVRVATLPAGGAAPPDEPRTEPEVFMIVHAAPPAPADDSFGLF
jgi:hypothetical protein